MRRLLPILASATLLLTGCSSRERSNPFDPLNPQTSGRPSGFAAFGGDREVRLLWQEVQASSLTGYQVFRRAPGETEYRAITSVLGTEVTSFRDFALANGDDYSYRLYFVFLSGLGSHPAEDVAAPGAAVPWLVEAGGTDLIQVTPDDRRVVMRRGGFGATTDLAANPGDGTVWVTDEGSGRVVVYQPLSGVTTRITGLNQPHAVAVDPFDATAWVCDLGQNLVHHFTPRGDPASESIAPLDRPVDVAVDPEDGSVWVCEHGGDRLGRFDPITQASFWRHSLTEPSRVAVDSVTREGWVTSYETGTVTQWSRFGDRLLTLTAFNSPLGVAVDARRGRIWIADPGDGAVIALRRDGSEEFRVTGLVDAGDLSVDLGTGDAWVVLADPGQLARVSAGGVLLRRLVGLRTPIAVSVDPGGR
jgi:DNA-binding beta-propeller fold protein YncE